MYAQSMNATPDMKGKNPADEVGTFALGEGSQAPTQVTTPHAIDPPLREGAFPREITDFVSMRARYVTSQGAGHQGFIAQRFGGEV